ncbi:hypothetical protein [Microbispora sp. KK1-11]|uniref:hypothetical protein n=1 Tax=Microbispora sp. KK1-11 TaxID=2053005 RepID=UPI0011582F86|nr:hypothetical protein [Microbispora sp. KK1-11]TQS29587.1 hypothetical protein FLW16_08105 [Microbispora sp. KK1-11]
MAQFLFVRRIRFTQSARKHRIGTARVLAVIRGQPPRTVPPPGPGLDEQWHWLGVDDRGLELEVIAVLTEKYLLVIHAMPTALRRNEP